MRLSRDNGEPKITRTIHAMIVPWGLYARQIGLVQRLEEVPIAQRKRDYAPQTKLIEFLVAILSGCRYLQDISTFPLDGGLGSGENLAWLIEMGYEVYDKAMSDKVTGALKKRVIEQTAWKRVGDNIVQPLR